MFDVEKRSKHSNISANFPNSLPNNPVFILSLMVSKKLKYHKKNAETFYKAALCSFHGMLTLSSRLSSFTNTAIDYAVYTADVASFLCS